MTTAIQVASCAPGLIWPGVPSPAGAAMLAMQWQFERSERLAAERLIELQFRQIRVLVAHALAHVPYYAQHLPAVGIESVDGLNAATFGRWPILETRDLQRHAGLLQAARWPQDHGVSAERFTSGSSGTPKRILDTQVATFYKDALLVREHLWHERDLSARFAGIHFFAVPGAHPGWNPAMNAAFRTGSGAVHTVATDVAEQWEWLRKERPAYLLTTPSNLTALVRRSEESRSPLDELRQVMTYAEPLPAGLRKAVQQQWGVPLVDSYSCTEAGALALQCPAGTHYHVQSENVYLEVLRSDGTPCAPGETGRVVITPLHNFAMPLLRYDLGDFAVAGERCVCGRGLPVLERIVGRVRNMARDAEGRLFQPGFDLALDESRLPVTQFQFVQETHQVVEMSYVMERDLTREEMGRFTEAVKRTLPCPFDIRFRRVPGIARGPGGKYEGFISRVG